MAEKTSWSDDDYKDYPQKWASKKEWKIAKKTLNRLDEMVVHRKNSCPFAQPLDSQTEQNVVENGGRTGTDWITFWDRSYKAYLRWREYDTDRSNLKAATSFAAVEAFMSEFQDINNTVLFSEVEERDAPQIKLHEKIQHYWETKYTVKEDQTATAFSTAIYGTSIPFVGYQKLTRNVNLLLTGKETEKEAEKLIKEYVEERDDKVQRILDETKPLTKKMETWVYNDCIYIPTSIYDIYIDPTATSLEGSTKRANDVVWMEDTSLNNFKSEFLNLKDPYLIKSNIKKVKGAADTLGDYGETIPFFKYDDQIWQKDNVRVVRYFNLKDDKYIILANDIVVREGPLPYNHGGNKKLPFVRHRLFRLDNEFYGVGFPGHLQDVQAEQETLKNADMDLIKLNNGRKMLTSSDIHKEIADQWEDNEPGQIVEVPGDVGQNKIRWSDPIPYNPQSMQLRQENKSEETLISGMNPIIMSQPKPGEPVRNNLMANESSIKNIKKLIKNYMQGWKQAVWMWVMIRQQYLPEKYADELQSEPIRLEDVKISMGENPVTKEFVFEIDEEEGAVSYISNLTEEMLAIKDIDLQLNVDALAPVSQGLKIQNAEKAFNMFMPLMQNPALLEDPFVKAMVREIIKVNGFDPQLNDLLGDEDSEEEVMQALEQEDLMLNGKDVPGIPGESEIHRLQHTQTILDLVVQKESLLNDPMQDNPEKFMEIEQSLERLAKHISIDNLPKTVAPKAAPDIVAQSNPQPAPMPGPEMGGMMPLEQVVDGMNATPMPPQGMI